MLAYVKISSAQTAHERRMRSWIIAMDVSSYMDARRRLVCAGKWRPLLEVRAAGQTTDAEHIPEGN